MISRKLAGIAVLAMLAACGPKQIEPRDVSIKLDWSTAGVAIADGHGTFTTDLGYTIEADKFEVTAYSFELLPCDPLPPKAPGTVVPQKSSFSLIGTAWAGHRTDHPPTLTNKSRVEAPLRGTALTLEQLRVPDVAYCSAHYLIARLPDKDVDPADAANVDIALCVHGRYRKGDGAWAEFTVETPVSHGILIDVKPEGSKKGIRIKDGEAVVLMRRLDTAFNGVDFGVMEPSAIARQILRQLVAGASLIHETGAQH